MNAESSSSVSLCQSGSEIVDAGNLFVHTPDPSELEIALKFLAWSCFGCVVDEHINVIRGGLGPSHRSGRIGAFRCEGQTSLYRLHLA